MKEEDFYQIFITGTGEYLDELLSRGLGGVIFFSKDINSADGFKDIISGIKKKSVYAPFLAIDQEGGRVERTENIRPRRLSAKDAYERGAGYLREQTEEMAGELKSFGINLNFAPVVDVNTNPDNPVIGNRAFGDNPLDVIKGAEIVMDVYKHKGIITCAKHYPGHGDTITDSHNDLPVIDLPLKDMEKTHLMPFKYVIKSGIPMIMAAHLDCKCFGEAGVPVSLSVKAIEYLRSKLGFKGVIITDDMNMGGVAGFSPEGAALAAIKAGVDILLYRASDKCTYDVINNIYNSIKNNEALCASVDTSVRRIKSLKERYLL